MVIEADSKTSPSDAMTAIGLNEDWRNFCDNAEGNISPIIWLPPTGDIGGTSHLWFQSAFDPPCGVRPEQMPKSIKPPASLRFQWIFESCIQLHVQSTRNRTQDSSTKAENFNES